MFSFEKRLVVECEQPVIKQKIINKIILPEEMTILFIIQKISSDHIEANNHSQSK
ncbi:MAG: hypothetical protein QG611_786 [Bacteroidota bacterium]|nr:hypothetical protein [Bacteroidota bacterium]